MSYLKFNADHLFTGTEMLGKDSVLITSPEGAIMDIVPITEAGENIRYYHGIISPGFVNCHCHLELSHMKGLIPEHTGLVDFVCRIVSERNFQETEILDAIAMAEDEMIRNGIVAVGDICNNTSTLPRKQAKNLSYYNFIEVSGWVPSVALRRFQASKAVYEAFINEERQVQPHGRGNTRDGQDLLTTKDVFNSSIVPHAPYSVSEELWRLIEPCFTGKTVSIHNQETSFEDELFIQNNGDFLRMFELMNIDHSFFQPSGKSSLQTYFGRLRTAGNVILVHNTFTTPADIAFAIEQSAENHQQLFWCLCVNANLYIEDRLPPVPLLLENGCQLVLGTDSLASNWNLSILDEMKTIHRCFPTLGMTDLLRFATLNGAKALQMDHLIGSFEKGRLPGIVLIEGAEDRMLGETASVQRLL